MPSLILKPTTPNTAAPFTDTVNGLSATFSGSASVCASNGLFQSLSGNVLIQSLCGQAIEFGSLTIFFSSNLTGISFNFAATAGSTAMTLAAFENTVLIGTQNFTPVLPTGRFNAEGFASFSGTFNRVTLTSGSGAFLALDNVNASASAVPEPASLPTGATGVGLLAVFARRRRRIN